MACEGLRVVTPVVAADSQQTSDTTSVRRYRQLPYGFDFLRVRVHTVLITDVSNERDLLQVQPRLRGTHGKAALRKFREEPPVQVGGLLLVRRRDGAIVDVVPNEVSQRRLAVVPARAVVDLAAYVLDHSLQYRRGINPPHRQPHVLA